MGKNYLLLILSFFTTVLSAQTVNIPDLNFKSVLLESSPTTFVAKDLSGAYFKIDANNDGAIQVTEALNVSWLFITSGITDFTGIQSFTNLSTLQIIGSSATSINLSGLTNLTSVHIYRNSQLSGINLTGLSGLLTLNLRENNFTTIDLSGFGLSALINLYLQNNQLSNVNLNGLTTLKILYAHENQISSIDLTGLTSLTTVWLGDNLLTSFHLNGNFPNLHTLFVENNLLTSFSISNLPALDQLAASNNQLTSITFDSSLLNLKHIFLENNFFSEIDISSLGNVTEFGFNNNPSLTSLNLKNGFDNNYLYFAGVPNLRYICGDENEIPLIQNALAYDNYTGVVVSSYCSFVPGGTFYTIEGNTHFDLNANGCDSNDIIFPNQKFTVTDGTISGAVISNTTGSYSIPIPAGSHIITPVLENPDYFTVSPTSVTTNFPGSANPFIQDFCVTANGIKNDLEVTIIPLNLARPGFNSLYKIIFKNKGNQAANGILNFNFNDALMDLISAIPAHNGSRINSLSWNFTNLNPFETREIVVTFDINGPNQTPSVNAGDILSYTAALVGGIDQTPNDNTFTLNQTLVNSLDPNNKTCLEGTVVAPESAGEFVHYLIRFENTGTFAAENVVVKDMIDTAKFDISTLVPLSSSHSYVTKISNTNKVEFIFENINLPFDDTNNDGYIVFKIRTKPTLVAGDTFSNAASIYFDYNFPIITNTATTILQLLGTPDFDFSTMFSLSPVPVENILSLSNRQNVSISSISIYNTLGQLILVNTNPEKDLDVSALKSGTYFIKIVSDKGTAGSKFIKE